MQRFLDSITLREHKRRLGSGDTDVELLTIRGDQMHVISLGLVFLYSATFTIANYYFQNFPQTYLTFIPVPLSVLFYFFFRWGGVWGLISKLANLLVLLSLLVCLKLLDGPATGILTFFIPVIVGSMITFQGKQRIYSWVGVSFSLLVLIVLSFIDWQIPSTQPVPESKLLMERVQNYFGAAMATALEVGFLLWVSNQLQDKLIENEQEKQRLTTRLALQSQERQRNTIAIELHENINQILASAKLNLSMIPSGLADPDKVRESEEHIEYALFQIRKLYHTLVTPDLQEFDWVELLRQLTDEIFSEEDIEVQFDAQLNNPQSVSLEIKLSLYRIAQEHLMNIRQHASAGRLQIRLTDQQQCIFFSVEDDGVGFDLNKARIGLGIRSMENRVSLHNGSIRFDTASGQGCRLHVELPFE